MIRICSASAARRELSDMSVADEGVARSNRNSELPALVSLDMSTSAWMERFGGLVHEWSGAAVHGIAALRLGDALDHQRFKYFRIEIGQPLEVQAGLANLVLPQLGEERLPPAAPGEDIDDQVPAANGKGCEAGLPGVTALVRVAVPAVANDAGPPHLRRL